MLIKDIPDLQKYVEVSADLDIRSVAPAIRKAERRYIIPILGAFYNEVQQMVDNSTTDEIEKQLIDIINCASGPLAMWYYVQVGGVSIDNSGVYVPKNANRWNLGEKELDKLKNAFLLSGLDALDDLLVFLNANLATFTTYADSEQREEYAATLVPNAAVVQKTFTMLHPHVTYRALREAITYVEPRVAGAMQEFYDHALDPETELTANEKKLKALAQRAIVYMAASRALITRTVKLTNEGLEVMMGEGSQVTEFENSRIEAASSEFAKSGEVEFENLISLMNKVPPTGYTPPVVTPPSERSKCEPGSRIVFL